MNRRQMLAAALTGATLPIAGASAQAQTPVTTGDVMEATLPAWRFAALALHDPYEGQLQVPASPPANTRVVAIQVEVTNDSDQALDFTPVDVRLRDESGMEYRGGSAIGAEPMINPRNLNPGERSRGWIWFLAAAEATIVEIVYVAPQPQFRIPLP